jgi:outer membrane receptor protein involved in Fe transport
VTTPTTDKPLLIPFSRAIPFLMLLSFLLLPATSSYAQNIATETVTIGLQSEPLVNGIKKIEEQTPFRFFYRKADTRQVKDVYILPKTRTVEATLQEMLQNTFFSYRQMDGHILLERDQSKGQISGIVVDSQSGKEVEFASVAAIRDSVIVSQTVSDSKGKFALKNLPFGKYQLKVSFMGYETLVIDVAINTTEEVKVGVLKLVSKYIQLSQVDVTIEKEAFENLIDKKAYNLDKWVLRPGETVLNVLKNIPSVDVDMKGMISIRGNLYVQILINGKPSALSASALLEQIPANSIARIEVISNPSARFDAESTGGIINIILKKNRQAGYNGNVNAGGGARQKYNTGVVLNYNTAKFNISTNYAYRYWELTHDMSFFTTNTRPDTTFFYDLNTRWMGKKHTHRINTGIDYEIDKRNSLNLSGTFNYMKQFSPEDLENRFIDENQVATRLYQRKMRQHETTPGWSGGLNYRRTYKKVGKELTAGVNYSSSLNSSTLLYDTRDYTPDYTPLPTPPRSEEHVPVNGSRLFTAQADYIQPLSKGIKLEAGVKSTVRNSDNELVAEIYNYQTNNFEIDRIRTNHFLYQEQINALYAIFVGKIKSFQYQLGNRLEHTYLHTNQLATKEDSNQVYLSYFPSFHLLKKLAKSQQVQFAYSRRINRPTVGQLNPVTDYPDTLFIGMGNPKLVPEYIHSVEAGYGRTWEKASFNSTAYYRRSSNLITGITTQKENGVSIIVPQNIKGSQSYGLELISSYKLSDKIGFNGSANIFQRVVDARNINTNFINSSLTWIGKLNSNIRFNKATEMQFNFNYRSGTVLAQAKNNPIYTIDGSLRRNVLKGQGSLNLSVSDILNTLQYSEFSYGDNFNRSSLYKGESRVITLNMSYKFGKVKKAHEAIRRRDPNNTGRQYEDIYD